MEPASSEGLVRAGAVSGPGLPGRGRIPGSLGDRPRPWDSGPGMARDSFGSKLGQLGGPPTRLGGPSWPNFDPKAVQSPLGCSSGIPLESMEHPFAAPQNRLCLFWGPVRGPCFGTLFEGPACPSRVPKRGPQAGSQNRSKSLKSKEFLGNPGSLATPCQKPQDSWNS